MLSQHRYALVSLCLLVTGVLSMSAATPADKPKSPESEETPVTGTGTGVEATANIKSGQFTSGQISGPSFEITVVIRNHTTVPLELGDAIIVLEKEIGSDAVASSYVARERAMPANAGTTDPGSALSQVLRDRYQLDWGEDIDAEGKVMHAFAGGFGYSFSILNKGVYEGLGWGRVSPRAERTITHELPFPFKIKGQRQYLAVVLPWIRPVAGTAEPAVATILRFQPHEVPRGAGHKLIETLTIPMKAAELKPIVTNTDIDPWRRVFALNWLVESSPTEAVPLLISCVTAGDAPEMLRIAAAANLGALKEKSAVQPLLDTLAATEDDRQRISYIDALGAIGDIAAAPAIRPFLDHQEDRVANAAIKAAGMLKDPEAVAPLLAILGVEKDPDSVAPLLAVLGVEGDRGRQQEAATALAEIGSAPAIEGLIGVLRSGSEHSRALAAEQLGLTGSTKAVAALTAVAADPEADTRLRTSALRSLGKLGGPKALAALRAGADSDDGSVRGAALAALMELEGNVGVPVVIECLETPAYPSKDVAARLVEDAKISEALPALRTLAAEKQEPSDARQAACRALSQMEDKQGVDALRTALDDSNGDVYRAALSALRSIAGPAADDATIAALQSAHEGVRRTAVRQIKEAELASAAGPLWQVYKLEKDVWLGSEMAQTLIEIGFSDQSAVDFLLARLNPKTNKLWYSDVELLRMLTKQDFGPKNKRGKAKERKAALKKWHAWAASRK
jgi:HEAT repeat protein